MKTIRMRKEDWAKWDAALRSGEYVQGTEVLCTVSGGYCCLGVLQKVLDGDVERYTEGHSKKLPSIAWLDNHGIQFDSKDNEESFDEQTPYLPLLDETADAANDAGTTFIEIANAIKDCVEFTVTA